MSPGESIHTRKTSDAVFSVTEGTTQVPILNEYSAVLFTGLQM